MRFRKAIFVTLGSISLGLGVLGIFLPLLPATPFFLLAAALYTRGSPRLHAWLLGHPRLGPYITAWRAGRGVPHSTKVTAIALLWASIGASVLLVLEAWPLRLLLLAIAAGVTAHLLRLPTLREAAGERDTEAEARDTGAGARDTEAGQGP